MVLLSHFGESRERHGFIRRVRAEELFVLPSPGQNMVAVQRKHVATKKKAPDVETGCLVLFVTQSFPRRDFLKAASA